MLSLHVNLFLTAMTTYRIVLISMIVIAVIVFFALFHVKAGYGYLSNGKWGPKINNRLGWILMESPVFLLMLYMFLNSPRSEFASENIVFYAMSAPFFIHYFQRSFIFPLLIKGHGKMPLTIILMGVIFNTINAYMQGEWLYYLSPAGRYTNEWLSDPRFLIGMLIFIAGFYINLQSDYIIRNLRKPGDTKHYIPKGGMFKYVCSANYFGELTEWVGFAILTWSVPGAVFALWTFANLAPRAKALDERYAQEFGSEYTDLKRKYILPNIW